MHLVVRHIAELEHFLDLVVLVEEAVALREGVARAVDSLPGEPADEAGLEVIGEDRALHLIGARVPLGHGGVLGQVRQELVLVT